MSTAGVLGPPPGLPPADGGEAGVLVRRSGRGEGVARRLRLDADGALGRPSRRRPVRVPGVLPPAAGAHGQPTRCR